MCSDNKSDSEHRELIRQHYKFLIGNLDLKRSLIAEMYSKNILSSRETSELEASDSLTPRIERLLSMLSRKSSNQFAMFLEALDRTGQRHITDKIRGKQTEYIIDVNGKVCFLAFICIEFRPIRYQSPTQPMQCFGILWHVPVDASLIIN